MIHELDIQNQLRCFNNGQEVLDYLRATEEQPFIILCDINMPIMNGIELRKIIDQDKALKKKAVPFIFLSTYASPGIIQQSYETQLFKVFFERVETMQKPRSS